MEADAIITNLKNVVIGILTADCVPVLIYDPIKRAAGVAHAGWKERRARHSLKDNKGHD